MVLTYLGQPGSGLLPRLVAGPMKPRQQTDCSDSVSENQPRELQLHLRRQGPAVEGLGDTPANNLIAAEAPSQPRGNPAAPSRTPQGTRTLSKNRDAGKDPSRVPSFGGGRVAPPPVRGIRPNGSAGELGPALRVHAVCDQGLALDTRRRDLCPLMYPHPCQVPRIWLAYRGAEIRTRDL